MPYMIVAEASPTSNLCWFSYGRKGKGGGKEEEWDVEESKGVGFPIFTCG
jgi:hypothetical protein